MTKKPKKNRITKSTLAKINEDIKALASSPPDDFSPMDAVRQCLPYIEDALASGHTMEKVHEALTKRGIQITLSTLSTYVRRARHDVEAAAENLPSDSQIDEAPEKAIVSDENNTNDVGQTSQIRFTTLDEAEEPFPHIEGSDEASRSSDDELIDQILDERKRKADNTEDQNNSQT